VEKAPREVLRKLRRAGLPFEDITPLLPGLVEEQPMRHTEAFTFMCLCIYDSTEDIRQHVIPDSASTLLEVRWYEAFAVAKAIVWQICLSGPESCEGGFRLPLPGLAGWYRFSALAILKNLASLLYENQDAIFEYFIGTKQCTAQSVAMLECLVIASEVLGLDDGTMKTPSAIELNAWKAKIDALLPLG